MLAINLSQISKRDYMKFKNKSLIILSVLAFVCVMPLLFAAGGDAAAEAGDETSSYVKFITTIFGQEPGEPGRFFTFLGRFHPLVLHLPIGMVVLAFHLMAFAIWKKRDDLDFAYVFALGFGFITACVAVLFGSFLAMSNDYNIELIDRHGWGGLVFAILVGVSFFLMLKFMKSDKSKDTLKKASFGLLAVNLGVMSLVGHDGGSLTHGKTYLFEYGPDWVRAIEGLPPYKPKGEISGEDTVYDALVAPFLKKHCYECHSEAKIKGKLRLDTIDFIKQGGKTENLIVHGNAEKSYFYELMIIDDEDEIMPPDGQLPQDHTDFIKWWIDTAKDDADLFERKIKDANVPEKFMKINQKGKKAKVPHKGADEEAKAAPTEKVEDKASDTAATAVAGKINFAKVIAPILETRCVKCHGEKKQKGDYRLDKAEFVMLAGESEEKPIVKGKAEESYLYKLVILDEDHDDVMPPKGGPLTKVQIAAIKAWIDQGADFPADLQLKEVDPKAAQSSAGTVDFAKQVAPIFEARCIKCHGDKKQKGEYRMDKAEFIQVAGESEEKPVVPGKPAESYLVKLIKMSEDADDVMPPKGGTLKPEEIAIIEKWIEQGAKFPADLSLEDKSPKK